MRRLSLGLAVFLAVAFARAEQADWKTRLAAAIARAVAQNPEIAGMESRIEAARHRVGQSTALPDPELELALKDFPVSDFSLSRDEMTAEMVGLRQAFPAPGKRSARKALAEAELAGAAASHDAHLVRLAAEVAEAFFTLGEIDGRIAIAQRSRDHLRRIAASVSERYGLGKGTLADVLRANLEVTATDEKLVALRGERRLTAARWNALQALPPSDPVAPAALPAEDPVAVSDAELLGEAEARSPAVEAGRADVRRAEKDLSLASLEGRPDVTASAYYAHRIDYEDLAGLGVSVSLPFIQNKRLTEFRAEKAAELSGARANLETVRNGLRRGVAEARAELDRSLEQAGLYAGSILPQAETNARAAEEAYEVGQVDFLTYSRAALDLDNYAADLVMRRAAAWRALAALQAASGLPLVPGTPVVEENHE